MFISHSIRQLSYNAPSPAIFVLKQFWSHITNRCQLESNLIQRIVGAKREISTHEEYPEAINFYSHRFRWSCSDDRQRLNSIVTRTIAAKIALLTSTTLEIDLNKQTVFIGGHDGIDVDLAVQKLDVVRKYFVGTLSSYLNIP